MIFKLGPVIVDIGWKWIRIANVKIFWLQFALAIWLFNLLRYWLDLLVFKDVTQLLVVLLGCEFTLYWFGQEFGKSFEFMKKDDSSKP